MTLGDYRKNRRKVSAVAKGNILTNQARGSFSVSKLQSSNIIFDPLTTLTTSSDLVFTAPYSRFYNIRLVCPFTSFSVTGTSTIPTTGINARIALIDAEMYIDGVLQASPLPLTFGAVYSQGSLLASFQNSTSTGVMTLFDKTLGMASIDSTLFLESGQTVEFKSSGSVNGFQFMQLNTIVAGTLGGAATPGIIQTTGTTINFFYLDVAQTDPVSGAFTTESILENTAYTMQVSADYYLEINELDRE